MNHKSEDVIINSAISFAGAAQRIMRLRRNHTGPTLWLITCATVTLVAVAWLLVAAWYVIAFGVFAIVTIPYRLLRRGARKRKAEALRHRELMDALERQKEPAH